MTTFELVLFTTDEAMVRRAAAAAVDTFIVDWEVRGKEARQQGADTQINRHTVIDLRRVRGATDRRVLCRLNAFGPWTADEVEDAIAAGADELLLPMVREPAEVRALLNLCRERVGVGILVETAAAIERAQALATLPLSRVYVGLMDLCIERGDERLFQPIVDGTVARMRDTFGQRFGFGGLTCADAGVPVPCSLLAAEMARLGCDFSFLRRSFHRDVAGRDLLLEVRRVRAMLEAAGARGPTEVDRDATWLRAVIAAVDAGGDVQPQASR